MSESAHVVPEATARLQVATGTTTARVFACARERLAQLRAQEALWDHEVTREDTDEGVLETGEFPEDNVIGFRLHLRYDAAQADVMMRLRGAGAYFVDQGVDAAMDEFRVGFESCIFTETAT